MKATGLTLIELLLAIATIALLMAISLPALQSSRQHSRTILCGSNIRQLVLGLAVYETENETYPHAFDDTRRNPPPGGYPGNLAYDRPGWWWFNYICDYSRRHKGRNTALWCPSRQIENIQLHGYVLHGNYGVNQSVCKNPDSWLNPKGKFSGTPLRASEIPRPCETLLLVDSGYSMINWRHVTEAIVITLVSNEIKDTAYVPGLEINKKRHLWSGQESDAIYGRHPLKTVNVGFVDGHVSCMKADDLSVQETGDSYNNRPLWLPK